LKRIDEIPNSAQHPRNKTPESLASLVWQIANDNIDWGRYRISNQLKLLNIFLAASTVRNILQHPKPRGPSPVSRSGKPSKKNTNGCRISTWYPNHLWSIDLTEVYYWGLWKIYVLVAIDHFSRKVVAVTPLEGPNAGFVIDALTTAFENCRKPKHLISDQGSVFTSNSFREFLVLCKVKIRYGAIGEHGSVAVTERVIETLKYEWLKKVPVIRGYQHLVQLCTDFSEWYNNWRPHEFLGSATPTFAFQNKAVPLVSKIAKNVPVNLETKRFKETKVTAYRIKKAA
jgi:transposase InsO family protein